MHLNLPFREPLAPDLDDGVSLQTVAEVPGAPADAAGLRLEHALAKVPPVDVDPVRIAQLLDNLISNAVKFSPAGGTVRAVLEQHEGCVRISVADNGPGIPADERHRVFDRFYRRSGQSATGSGLGLAIVRSIAQRHKAEICLGHTVGAGLTVRIKFPGASRMAQS